MKTTRIVLLILSLFAKLSHAETITIVADAWPPYNITPNTSSPGYIVEVAEEVLSNAGYQIEYIKMPWNRAVKAARSGKFHGIIGATKPDAPDFIFPDNEQGVSEYTFFTIKESDWVYRNITSLENQLLGVVSDYSYSNEIDTYIQAHSDNIKVQVVYGKNPLEQNLNKLIANRISVFIDDRRVTNYLATRLNIRNRIREAGLVSRLNIYIAFSPAHEDSNKLADILSDGMTELRANGKLQQILAKYQLSDWSKTPSQN
ncbi:hypothetical protein DRW07_00880 [Alteromonas sediminis]|uniref:Solute-binding protein family 3/N-terminal domain-containing protein n=1 Tax=Alteromonas sediminis TaxID=2259342 RepID=A0A3N5YPY8_9ALTE|nr:transporter substrate-binding domain-containing protein [Alteromonas sediminis]RPJ68001.1 hypothetical protein DRW07_00880 [Alteromonas sediminis]